MTLRNGQKLTSQLTLCDCKRCGNSQRMIFRSFCALGSSMLTEMLLSITHTALNFRETVQVLKMDPPPPASHFPCLKLRSNWVSGKRQQVWEGEGMETSCFFLFLPTYCQVLGTKGFWLPIPSQSMEEMHKASLCNSKAKTGVQILCQEHRFLGHNIVLAQKTSVFSLYPNNQIAYPCPNYFLAQPCHSYFESLHGHPFPCVIYSNFLSSLSRPYIIQHLPTFLTWSNLVFPTITSTYSWSQFKIRVNWYLWTHYNKLKLDKARW